MYSEKVMDHFKNPRNVGEIRDFSGRGEMGSTRCGDTMVLTIKVGAGDVIEDVKFQTFGCAAAIASSSIMTEMVLGKTLQEALEMTNDHVAEALGGLPAPKMHCSNLAADALQKAIEDYRKRQEAAAAGTEA